MSLTRARPWLTDQYEASPSMPSPRSRAKRAFHLWASLTQTYRCWTGLAQIFEKLSREPNVRAVVLASANPKLFSAGIDRTYATTECSNRTHRHHASLVTALGSLSKGASKDPSRRALQQRDAIHSFQDCISAIERCPYPVIAATHGIAYGLSVDIISACDIRYTASNAVFSVKVLRRLYLLAGRHSVDETV